MKNDAKNIILWLMIPLFLLVALLDFYATKKAEREKAEVKKFRECLLTDNYTNDCSSLILRKK
jgi:hypothetical protein